MIFITLFSFIIDGEVEIVDIMMGFVERFFSMGPDDENVITG